MATIEQGMALLDRLNGTPRRGVGPVNVSLDLGPAISDIAGELDVITRSLNGVPALILERLAAMEARQMPVDLSPVLNAVARLGEQVEAFTEAVCRVEIPAAQSAPVKDVPREWVFDVNRNSAGFIRSVDVKAK